MNTYQAFAPFSNSLLPVLFIAAIVMFFVDQMWKKLPPDHPAVYRETVVVGFESSTTEKVLEGLNV